MSRLLIDRFLRMAAERPDAPAVQYEGRTVTYGELEQQSARVAASIRAQDHAPGSVIGLCLQPGPDYVAVMLGVSRAGCAWLPLSPDWPEARTQAVVERAAPAVVIRDGDVAALMSADPAATTELPSVQAEDLQYLMFTSGSTGEPQGVRIRHGNTAGLYTGLGAELEFSARDTWSALHAPVFGFSVWELWGPLSTGGCLCIVPGEMRNDPARWFPTVLAAGVSVLSLTPSGFRQLLATDCVESLLDELRATLRLIVFSGEAMRSEDIEAWYARVGSHGPRLVNTYAVTETAGRITWGEYQPGRAVPPGWIGQPVSDAEVFILDEQQCSVAPGEVGEVYVSGPMLGAGYLGEPDLTAQRFVHLNPGDGARRLMYRTGDRARFAADGSIEFAGRRDDQVKVRGYRVDLGEVERALRAHPRVGDAAVVLDDTGSEPKLRAFVVDEGAQPDSGGGIEFWPSLGEYQVYDDLLYDFMSADELRVASYRRAFDRHAQGKVVLDIGTGKDALLARLAAAAGARHVYAVEVLPDAARQARQLVDELGLVDRITVLEGDMQSVQIPEPVDICTQGIVGNIGSSDGIVPIWNSARPLFRPGMRAVPERCTTLIAPAGLPDDARQSPAFGALATEYARRIFESADGPFDVRLCVRNFPPDCMLAEPQVFESLDFSGELSANYEHTAEFVAERDGAFDGFLLWTRIDTDADEAVDFLAHQQAWLPVWFPVADEPVELRAGDRLQVRWACSTPAGDVFPDYRIEVRLPDGRCLSYVTRHHETALGQTALHRALLDSMAAPEPRDWLRTQLPDYMQPQDWQTLDALPLNASGKLDRQALRGMPAASGSDREPEPTAEQQLQGELDGLEAALARIWAGVLQRSSIDPDVDFFDQGGDSIAAVRLTTEVQRLLDATIFLGTLFEAPTVRAYAAQLRRDHADAVAALLPDDEVTADNGLGRFVANSPRTDAALPLSWPQQSLWFLDRLYPGNTGANEQFLVRMHGALDTDRFVRAWHALLDAHEALRTAIVTTADGVPCQMVMTPDALPDALAIEPDAISEDDLRNYAAVDIHTPFALDRAPLLRARLFTLGPKDRVLLVTAHHIIADGLCVPLVRDALAHAYASGSLPTPACQYPDFARWQLERGVSDEGVDWWVTRLAGHAGQPAASARRGSAQAAHERRLPFTIDAGTADALRRLGREHGATLYMTLLCAWRAWLSRCLNDADLLIGTPVTLRTDAATADMIGCMVNNVVVRNPLVRGATFVAALEAERDAVVAAVEHSDVPFERVVEAVDPVRLSGRHPLFQLLFMFEDRSAPPVTADGVSFATDVLPVDRATYWDLEFSVTDRGEGAELSGFIGVREDVYDVASLSWWPEGFVAFVDALSKSPTEPVTTLTLLSAEQRRRVLIDWNATAAEELAGDTLDTLFGEQAARTPDAVAVRDEEGALTYGALAELAARYAGGLRAEGVGAGDLVGLAVPRGRDAIALQIAIARLGAAWLPLDPSYPRARLEFMRADAQPKLVVATTPELGGAACIAPEALREAGALGSTDLTATCARPDGIAYALYTSGSTGTPKGVLATHASAVSRCRWMWRAYGFGPADVFAQRTSLNFVDSIWEVFGPLGHGACVDVLPVDSEQDPAAMAQWIEARGITHMVFVPPLLRALLDEARPEQLASLRSVITSGESLNPELVSRFFRRLPGVRLLNTYGTSETWDVSCHEVSPGDAEAAAVPVGRPVANAALCILDEAMQPVPPGVTGEVYAGGLGLAQGYIGQPELTAAAFVSSPLAELGSVRLYRTGDLGRFRGDGTVELMGRIDRQIKLRGLRIETVEIEAAALRRPDIEQCVAVLRTSQDKSQDNSPDKADWLALYCVAREGAEVDAAELRADLAERLPRQMVPADIVFLDALPLTPSGKLDLQALPDSAAPPTPAYEAPRGDVEQQLAGLWADALGVERVGRHDDFFALRGHSLLATRLIARICERFDLDVPLQLLFDAPTVAGLARGIEALRWMGSEQAADGDAGREVVRL